MGLAQVLIETTSGQNTHYLPGLAQYNGSAWNYYLPDRLSSVRQRADPTGAVLLAQSYDPFGNVLQQTGSVQSIFGYTGEQSDPTGLVFLRARYYNPYLNLSHRLAITGGDSAVIQPGIPQRRLHALMAQNRCTVRISVPAL